MTHPPPLRWENHDRYGIVHRSHCALCDSYREHLNEAAFAQEQSFQMALAQGNKLVKDKHPDSAEIQELRDEIAWLRTRLEVTALQAENKPCLLSADNLSRKGRQYDAPEQQPARCAREPLSHLVDTEPHCRPASSASSCTSFVTASTPEILEHSPASSAAAERTSSLLDPARLPQPRPWQSITASQRPAQVGGTVARSPQGGGLRTSTREGNLSAWRTVGGTSFRVPKYPNHVDALLKQANTRGNYDHVAFIKALCAEAHSTNPKTAVQQHLLRKWKIPWWVNGRPEPEPTPIVGPPLRDDPPELWVAYYIAHPTQTLPPGVRRDIEGKPLLSDITANRILARLRPKTVKGDPASVVTHRTFSQLVVQLFSIRHSYEQLLTWLDVTVNPAMTYTAFVGQPENVTLDDVARHFAACGISVNTAENDMGPWARERMRLLEEAAATSAGAGEE